MKRFTVEAMCDALAAYLRRELAIEVVAKPAGQHGAKGHLLDATAVIHCTGEATQAIVLTVSMEAAFRLAARRTRPGNGLEEIEENALQELLRALDTIVNSPDGAVAAELGLPCAFIGEGYDLAFPSSTNCEETTLASPIGALRLIVATAGSRNPALTRLARPGAAG